MRIIISVEGRTEKAFREALLRFLEIRLQSHMPKITLQSYDGRIPTGEKLQRIVNNYTQEADAVIALTDVYTGTKEFKDAVDAKNKMLQWVGTNGKFYPHVAQHDFEAWLLLQFGINK